MPKNSHLLVITFPGSVWSAPFRALADQVNKQEQKSLAEEAPDLPVVQELLGSDETATPLLLACELNSGILEMVAKCRTHTQTLVLLEDPRTFLSSLETRDDLPQLLKTWSDAAHMAIAAHRKSPGFVIIVSAEEARESPEAFIRFVGELHPACLNLQAPASDIDPVRHVLAHAELASLSDVLASARELEASCRDFGSSLVHSLSEARLAPAWEEWSKVSKSLQSFHRETVAKSLEIETLRVELGTQRESIKLAEETAAVMDALKSSLGEMKEENELLLVQLHQVQEELERHFLENKRLAADNQGLEAKHTSLVTSEKDLAARHEQASSSLKDLEAKYKDLNSRHSSLLAEHDSLVASSKEALEENELLLLQLHQVQEELEQHFLQNQELRRRPSTVSLSLQRPRLQARAVRIGFTDGSPPHLHLDFTLEEATIGSLSLRSVSLRLVEHHGRPGLLIFASPGTTPKPLMHWNANGTEADHDFMLVVPQDKEGRDFLMAATTTDLVFCEDAVALLMTALNGNEGRALISAARWMDVATAFLDRCKDVPVRLHYDDVFPELLDDGGLRFRVTQASVPGRHVAELDFVWRASSLILKGKDGFTQPLSHWPQAHEGAPAKTSTFDFDGGHRASETWKGLTGTDRLFLHRIVSELPNFLYHMEQKNPGASWNKSAYQRSAKTMKKKTRALLHLTTAWQRLAKALRP